MGNRFFEEPILNSPYECPCRHWELDPSGVPTGRELPTRRDTRYVSPIPRPRRQSGPTQQEKLTFTESPFDPAPFIKEVRYQVDQWRKLPNPADWQVTHETSRLLQHWRYYEFNGVRPFFCQVEAVEAAIWLTEAAPASGKRTANILDHLASANAEANPGLDRLALKLATGAGKTTVMAMLISGKPSTPSPTATPPRFTNGFLIVTPGLTIKDRLRVLQPNDSEGYYKHRELIPADLAPEINKAKIDT